MPLQMDNPAPVSSVRFSYAVELIMAATLATNRPSSLTGFDPEWRQAQLAVLPPAALAFIARTERYSCPTLSLLDFVPLSGEYDDPDRLFAAVRALPLEEFVYAVLNSDLPRPVVASVLADPPSAAAWTSRLSFFSRMPPEDLVVLCSAPGEFREALLSYVAANRTEVFERRVEASKSAYEARSKAIKARLAVQDPLALAEDLKKRPFPKDVYRTHVFVPSYFEGRMSIVSAVGDAFLFIFNIDPMTDGGRADGLNICERLRALGDPTRLEIMRLLRRSPSYGKELSAKLGLTTATVSRHLDQLKGAGLVLEDKADAQNVKLVRMDRQSLEALFDSARQYLLSDPPASCEAPDGGTDD